MSVIIPTRDKLPLLQRCVDGLLARTDFPMIELIILDNGSVEPATHDYLAQLHQRPNVQVLRMEAPFNFSALCNLGARTASGQLFCFLNNDMAITERGWLEELAGLALQPEVGAVGPLLRYPDGRLQDLGVRVDPPWPRPIGDGLHDGPQAQRMTRLRAVHNVSAISGGCLVTRRAAFTAVGGFDEALAVTYNDVDFCFKLRAAGYWIVWTPFAALHHELSATRGQRRTLEQQLRDQRESLYLRQKWPDLLAAEPFYTMEMARW